MIKNIIFDVGGILFDDSLANTSLVLGEDATEIYHKAYGTTFRDCLLGDMMVAEHVESFKRDADYPKLKYLLSKENLHISYPLLKENLDYIVSLKDRYSLYLLTNITVDSYEYISNTIDIDSIFSGGVYSFREHIVKPDKRIYNLLLDRYHLLKEETIFFDDRRKNVDAAIECGIAAAVFTSIEDIKTNLEEDI